MSEDLLQVRSVSFYKSLRLRSETPIEPRPEIAFAGKSNSGKSSLINYLCGRKKLAYTGKQPGKTRLVNYFVVNDAFYLVDLPGYGYARVSRQELAAWADMMETFFFDSEKLLHGLVICTDIRRDPSEQDLQMVHWAAYYDIPCVIAATKSDKISRSRRPQAAADISRFFRENLEGAGDIPVIPVSSLKKTGGEDILDAVGAMLDAAQN